MSSSLRLVKLHWILLEIKWYKKRTIILRLLSFLFYSEYNNNESVIVVKSFKSYDVTPPSEMK